MKANWNKIDFPRKQSAIYTWNAAYAATIHEGATLRNGTILPPRPWVDRAVERIDAPEVFGDAYANSEDFRAAFEEMAIAFGATAQDVLTSEEWGWPRQTRRQNGSVVGSPRDIIDTGELRDSYQVEIQ